MKKLAPLALLALLLAHPVRSADITVTAASVAKGSTATVIVGTAGETITAGQCVYQKSSDSKLYKAKAAGTAEEVLFAGIALHGSLAGQPLAYEAAGTITIGGTVAVGTVYAVSATYGGVAPIADLASTNRVTVIGYGSSATVITLSPILTGVSVP
jgi:hypothetical protein